MNTSAVPAIFRAIAVALLLATPQFAQLQGVRDPIAKPIASTEGVITVQAVEFASLPDTPGQAQPARMMLLLTEPGTRRLFVNDMRGQLYSVSYDGKTVTLYLDVNAQDWGIGVQSQGAERGLQSFAFHPQFNQRGSRG